MSNKGLVLASGFARAPFNLGIGRYVCQLQRVTLKFCKTHGGSCGVRQFIENDLIDYARDNPGVVVYLKPRRHRSAVIKAEYLNGEEQWINVDSFAREDIVKWMELMRTQMKDGSKIRLRKLWHTDFPSIQGPWTPFTFKDPSINTAVFPNNALSAAKKDKPTATEELLRIFKERQEKLKQKETEEDVSHIKVQRGEE